MKLYGITDKNLAWFESDLSDRKQYIQIGEISKTDLKYVTYGIPQGSILGELLVYVNELPNASLLLDSIMFAECTNFSLSKKCPNMELFLVRIFLYLD